MRNKRSIVVLIAVVTFLWLFASACSAEKSESDPQRAKIEMSIKKFVDNFNAADIDAVKGIICGPLADDYRPVKTDNDLRRVVEAGEKLHGKTTLGTITTTSASKTRATANVEVVYVKEDVSTPDPTLATVEVNNIDGQWKVCRFDRSTQSSSTTPSPAG